MSHGTKWWADKDKRDGECLPRQHEVKNYGPGFARVAIIRPLKAGLQQLALPFPPISLQLRILCPLHRFHSTAFCS